MLWLSAAVMAACPLRAKQVSALGKAIQRPNFKMKPLRCVSSQDHLVSFFREQFLVKNYCHVLWVDFNRVQKGALHA